MSETPRSVLLQYETPRKTAIVTGASTGIGRSIAVELAKEGASVVLVSRSQKGLEETKKLIEESNGTATILQSDLSSEKGINELIKKVKDTYKRIDILGNIAGIWHGESEVYAGRDFETYSQKVISDTMFVGIMSPTLLSHAFIPFMKPQAKIINLSGTFESGAKGWLSYYVSKRAIEDLTIGLSEELKDKNIQVNAISPSDTATESYKKYFPQYINDSIDPVEIARHAVFLCTSEADNITGNVFILKKGQEPSNHFHY